MNLCRSFAECLRPAAWRVRQRVGLALLLVLSLLVARQEAAGAVIIVDLDTASDFAVLGGSAITITGPTTITGDIGSFPTPTITGFENVTLDGVNHAGDAFTQQAQLDLATAYTDAAGRTPTTVFGDVFDLGGLTLISGVYRDNTSFGITGTLTLDAAGDPNAVWIFQAGSTLITAAGSTVNLIGGARASHVFWQVGSSATLGSGTDFAGSIMALQSITLNSGAMVAGQVLARNGAVTLDSNLITTDFPAVLPEPGSALLVGSGLVTLLTLRRRFITRS